MSVFFKVYFHWQTFWWCSLKSQRKTLPAHLKSQCDLTASIHSQTMITFTSRHFLFPWVDYSSFNSAQTMMAEFGQHFFIWVLCAFRSSASIQHVIIQLQVCGVFFSVLLLLFSRSSTTSSLLSLFIEFGSSENTTSHCTSWWRVRPSCLKTEGRLWLLAHNVKFTLL